MLDERFLFVGIDYVGNLKKVGDLRPLTPNPGSALAIAKETSLFINKKNILWIYILYTKPYNSSLNIYTKPYHTQNQTRTVSSPDN